MIKLMLPKSREHQTQFEILEFGFASHFLTREAFESREFLQFSRILKSNRQSTQHQTAKYFSEYPIDWNCIFKMTTMRFDIRLRSCFWIPPSCSLKHLKLKEQQKNERKIGSKAIGRQIVKSGKKQPIRQTN